MASDTAFLSEVEAFLASCDLPALALNQTRSENNSRPPNKRSTINFEQESRSKDRAASRDPKCADENQQKTNVDTTTKHKSYYRRRKIERVNLRRQVSELTAELDKLRKTKDVNKLQTPSKWMAIAKSQEEERLNAEDQQRQLCVAIDTRAAMVQNFLMVTRDRLGELGRLIELEAHLIEEKMDAMPSGPFKRIRVDPPLDVISECYLNELNDPTDKSTSEGDSENEIWGDSGQVFQHSDKGDGNGSFVSVDTTSTIPNTNDSTSITIRANLSFVLVQTRKMITMAIMKPTKYDEEFLADVVDFLTTCDLPRLAPGFEESDNKDVDNSPFTQTKLTHPSPNKSDGIQRRSDNEISSKRMLKKANDRTRSRTYYQRRQAKFESVRQQVKELDARATLIHEFQTFLHNQLREQRNLVVDEGHLFRDNSYKHKKLHLALSDAKIFDIYVQELDVIYAQIDMALHDFELECTVGGSDTPKTSWKEDRKPGYFLYMDKQTISSEFQETCKFVWQVAFMMHRQENRDQCYHIDDPENIVATKFRISTRLNSGRIASILQHIVTRRYQVGERIVLAWRSLTEGEGMFSDMNADETGWCVATPIKGWTDTMLRTCMRHAPMHFRGVVTHNPEVKQFTRLVLDTGSNDVFETTIKLEELLLNNA